jgi:hypothetical protein
MNPRGFLQATENSSGAADVGLAVVKKELAQRDVRLSY